MKHSTCGFLATVGILSLSVTGIGMTKTSLLYIATQDPQKMGIVVAEFDSATGTLSTPKLVIETPYPSIFTLSADGKRLYLCNTTTPGGVSAFAVENPKTGALRLLNYKEAKGRGPSYVSIDKTGHYVLDANYAGGFVEVFSLARDGSLDQQTAFVQHEGSSVNPDRQTKAYAHWFRTDPTNNFGLVADLGMDKIMVYRFDHGKLVPNDPPFTQVSPGSGPRHMAFHPNGKWLYAVQELSNEVIAFHWDAHEGTLAQFQKVKTLPEGFTGANGAAEIAVRNDGKFLYASNRGHDSIAVFSIDAKSGELTLRQHEPSRGKMPRFFTLDPANRWLIVSNIEGNNVSVFSIDVKNGELKPTGEPVAIVKPMGIAFQ